MAGLVGGTAMTDVMVIGSGASAVHAAYPLVEAGREVLMLDVGRRDEKYAALIPDAAFEEIRRTDRQQHRYFLGDDFEGVPLGRIGTGPQVTPPRQFAISPLRAPGFEAVESFALGGLANAWGAVSFPYLDHELEAAGLPVRELRRHYEVVARRIGVSGANDDLAPLRGPLEALQPPLELDSNAEYVLARAPVRGLRVGRPLLAVLTQPMGERRPHAYQDMDFWSNHGDSVYRVDVTVRELQRRSNFRYCPGQTVREFREDAEGVTVNGFRARRLIVAAGTLGTTRIVLRSLGAYDRPVPLVCNAHMYISCLLPGRLGKPTRARRHSLAQLTAIYDPSGDARHLVQAQMYSYRSLMLFRLLRESPLPVREALRVLGGVVPAMAIWVVQHEDEPGAQKYCRLTREGELEIVYRPSDAEEQQRARAERELAGRLRRLGCWPLKHVHPGHGSSVHYAGSFPHSATGDELTTELTGRLRACRHVYLADGATHRSLPAKGLTLTLMANANRIGTHVAETL